MAWDMSESDDSREGSLSDGEEAHGCGLCCVTTEQIDR
jgi:hypothetical protein